MIIKTKIILKVISLLQGCLDDDEEEMDNDEYSA